MLHCAVCYLHFLRAGRHSLTALRSHTGAKLCPPVVLRPVLLGVIADWLSFSVLEMGCWCPLKGECGGADVDITGRE